jgi:oligopeptide/dipeptide ABC transporter ATP-binding protein
VDLLASVGLDADLAQRFPHELSGGQRQRVSIARAIATGPRIVVCDEPVSALDVSVRSQIMNLLLHLQRDLGLSYLFISHDLGLVDHVSDHVCVMYLGRIVEKATARQFFTAPRHPYSRALVASTPRPEAERRSRPAPILGEVGDGEPATGCSFRNRCPFAVDVCAQELAPTVSTTGAGNAAAHANSAGVRLRPRLRHQSLQPEMQPLQPIPFQLNRAAALAESRGRCAS